MALGHLLLGAVKFVFAAQTAQATLTGSVVNEQTGAPVANAVVTLTDLNRATLTDAVGRYLLVAIPAGPQHIAVRAIGYASRTLHALTPAEGQLQINISLRPLPVRLEPVRVRPLLAIRGAEGSERAAFPDRSSSIAAVRNHPLVPEADVLQALVGGEIVIKPEAPGGMHIRGGASDHTAYVLDGIPVFSPYHAMGLFSAWNADAIERVTVASSAPSPAHPDALSGAVVAVTRTPGSRLTSQASVSSTQARATFDGPLGIGDVGYLISARTSLSGLIAPRDEAYQRGETTDGIAKLEAPFFGGHFRVLGYHNTNEIRSSAVAADAAPGQDLPSNDFAWKSHSIGATWSRNSSTRGVRVLAWQARGDAVAAWSADSSIVRLTSARRDGGVLAIAELTTGESTNSAGVRVERIYTSYRASADPVAGASIDRDMRTPVFTAFAEHARRLADQVDFELATAVATFRGAIRLAPRARIAWRAGSRFTLSGSFARTHQFAQSLRNAESVVGHVFPADIFLSAGAAGVPVARSDQGIVAADLRLAPGVRIGAQAYTRRFDGIVLVAPRAGEPFARGEFAMGDGTSDGMALDVAVSRARWGVLGSYGMQNTRREFNDSSYVPDHGATHLIDGGFIVFPSPTLSLRFGASAAFGRRTSVAMGLLEFESCNLADRGCEFRGSPDYAGTSFGATRLPAYARVDVGFQKHWHVDIGDRAAQIALFGTVTNVAGHKNVLTYVRDPATQALAPVRMRPLAPLVVGLDWRY